MQRESPKLLEDIRQACDFIVRATRDKSLRLYQEDEMLRAAVERKFLIIGEALNRLQKTDPVLAADLPDVPHVIAFRNILVHGYDVVSDARVWVIIEQDVPVLLQRITEHLPSE